jgi:hypothetical protein
VVSLMPRQLYIRQQDICYPQNRRMIMTQNTNITALEYIPTLTTRYQRSAKEYYIKMDFIFIFTLPCIGTDFLLITNQAH